uniref:Uncharacterized protein n=1 Tax=Anguilla anguilla TaxID=7936 RepID=A0A0E9PG36_ANGAN
MTVLCLRTSNISLLCQKYHLTQQAFINSETHYKLQ